MTLIHCAHTASTVTRSQCNRATLRCDGRGDSHHERAARQICQICVILWCQYGPNSPKNISNILWINAIMDYGSSENKRGSNPVLARCTLQSGWWAMATAELCRLMLKFNCSPNYLIHKSDGNYRLLLNWHIHLYHWASTLSDLSTVNPLSKFWFKRFVRIYFFTK